jgi:hypothetical protein
LLFALGPFAHGPRRVTRAGAGARKNGEVGQPIQGAASDRVATVGAPSSPASVQAGAGKRVHAALQGVL